MAGGNPSLPSLPHEGREAPDATEPLSLWGRGWGGVAEGGVPAIAAIVLAAGFSNRMGRFKPLLPLGQATVLEWAVGSLLSGGIADVVVVAGHRAEDLWPYVDRLGCHLALNRRPELGMFSSVLTGMAALAADVGAAFILPVDVPLVRPDTIRLLAGAYLGSRASVLYPTYGGKRGHPPLVARHCFAEPLSPTLSGGLATVLAWRTDALDVPVADEGVLWDMDTQADYGRMLARVAAAEVGAGRSSG